jgi:hypothetical protein
VHVPAERQHPAVAAHRGHDLEDVRPRQRFLLAHGVADQVSGEERKVRSYGVDELAQAPSPVDVLRRDVSVGRVNEAEGARDVPQVGDDDAGDGSLTRVARAVAVTVVEHGDTQAPLSRECGGQQQGKDGS